MSIKLNDGSSLSLRSATQADCAIILQFIRALAVYEKLEHQVVANETLLAQTLFGPDPKAEVIIADRDGEPASFALFFYNYSTFLAKPGIYLEDLYVHKHLRGLGIGKLMLKHIARLAQERGCGRLEWSVLDWNKPAIDFYESLGAKPMSEWTIYRLSEEAIAKLVLS